MLEIISASSSILFEQAKEVKQINKSVLRLLDTMYKSLLSAKDPVGVGLAAPQVGHSLQIFIAKPTSKSKIQVFINPKIIQKTIKKTKISHLTIPRGRLMQLNVSSSEKSQGTKLEGCLSLPNIWGQVKRNPEVTLSYLNEKGENHKQRFNGFMATIIQHEMDHLNGILFPKKVLEQKGHLYKSSKNEKGEDVFEEVDL